MQTSKAVVEYLSGAASAAPFSIAEKRRSPNDSFLHHFTDNRFHAGNPLHSSRDCRRWSRLVSVCWCVLWCCAGGLWCVGGVCSVLCRRRGSRPAAGKICSRLLVVLVVGVEILSLFVGWFQMACLRLAGCGVRVSACCTCWCIRLWCA